MNTLAGILFVCISLGCAQARAQPAAAAPPAATVPTRLAPSVKVSFQPEKIGLLEDYVVDAELVNETSQPIQVRAARVCYSPDFVRARGGTEKGVCVPMRCPSVDESGGVRTEQDCNLLPAQVPVGQSHLLRHHDATSWRLLFSPSSWPALFMWTDRKTAMTVEIEYSGADAQLHKLSRQLSAQVSASLLMLLIGAWLGAALLAAFSLTNAQQDSPGAKRAHAGRLLVAGIVTGTIFLLLIQRVGDLDLPFKFAVNDVIGGVIVGLFSFKLGRMLYGYFFGPGQRARPDGTGEVQVVAKPD